MPKAVMLMMDYDLSFASMVLNGSQINSSMKIEQDMLQEVTYYINFQKIYTNVNCF